MLISHYDVRVNASVGIIYFGFVVVMSIRQKQLGSMNFFIVHYDDFFYYTTIFADEWFSY